MWFIMAHYHLRGISINDLVLPDMSVIFRSIDIKVDIATSIHHYFQSNGIEMACMACNFLHQPNYYTAYNGYT